MLGKWSASFLSVYVARLAGLDPTGTEAHNLVSGVSMAVIIGLVLRNAVGVPELVRPGLAWMLKTGLRVGIVLLGFKLALGTAGRISGIALPVVVVCIASALFVVTYFNRRLGLPPKLGALIAVGTSICGVTAIAATGPAIEADRDEISYAIACVTIFGLLAMFTYPWVAHAAFESSPLLAGIFLGTSIHDTSQVAGASLMYQEAFKAPLALQAATVTKLIRNMFMAVLIPVIATRFRTSGRTLTLRDMKSAVPGFVYMFLAVIVVRSVGDYVFVGHAAGAASAQAAAGWTALLDGASVVSGWTLAAALAGIGLNTDLARLRGLGLKPLMVGLVAALCVGLMSFVGLRMVIEPLVQ